MKQDDIKRLAEELFGPLQVPEVPSQFDPDDETKLEDVSDTASSPDSEL
jgi:hypothetical protein